MTSVVRLVALTATFLLLAVASAHSPAATAEDKKAGDDKQGDDGVERKEEDAADQNDMEKVKEKDKAVDDFESKKKATGVTPEEAEQIKKAIEKGARALFTLQKPDGQFELYTDNGFKLGGHAFVMLTLVKCGVERNDPNLLKAFTWLRKAYQDEKSTNIPTPQGTVSGVRVYNAGVILMLLEAYYTEVKKPKKDDGKAGKTKAPKPGADDPKHLARSPQDDAWIRELMDRLETTQNKETGLWAYPENYPYVNRVQAHGAPIYADFSNTQYAVLGLKAAHRMGYKVRDPEMYRRVAEFIVKTQDADGPKRERTDVEVKETPDGRRTGYFKKTKEFDRCRGWTYIGYLKPEKGQPHPYERTGSMTTAALAGLIVAKSELMDAFPRGKTAFEGSELDNKINEAVWDGIAWLEANFTVEQNPSTQAGCDNPRPVGKWHYYYLYGLERAGMFAGRDFFGEHEWYPLGARYLLKNQREDGTWDSRNGVPDPLKGKALNYDEPMADCCYALLFLKRASFPVGKPVPKPIITGSKK